MSLKQKFTEQDLERVRKAVKDAEDKISGEIVPVIVEKSGAYHEANFRSCLAFGTVAFALIVILDRYLITDASLTLYYDPMFIFFLVLVFSATGYFLSRFIPPVQRLFVTQGLMDEFTRQRAESAFLQEEVFNTRHRTGIMIFISFFEHEVIIMADRGISKMVEQKEWDTMVSDLISQIRQGKIVDGLEAGIKRCGEVLLEKGFHKTPDDINELRDDLRIN